MEKKNKSALVGFIFGLISTCAWIIPILGVTTSIIGIVFSAKSKGTEKKAFRIIGLVASIIFLVVSIITWILNYIILTETGVI